MPQRMIRPGHGGAAATRTKRGAVADLTAAGPGLTRGVDAMGGAHAPAEIVAGAVAAHRDLGIQVILAGQPGPLLAELATHGVSPDQIPHATGEGALWIDEGALAIRRRPRTSIAVACQL